MTARPELRRKVEDAIERLIAYLDTLDPDPDLEPSLGYYDASRYAVDAEHDTADEEFTLGAAAGDGNQERWSQGENTDREASAAPKKTVRHRLNLLKRCRYRPDDIGFVTASICRVLPSGQERRSLTGTHISLCTNRCCAESFTHEKQSCAS